MIRVRRCDYHLTARAFLAVLLNEAGDIGITQPERARPLLAVSQEALPAAIAEVTLHCFKKQFLASPTLFVGSCLYFGEQRRRHGDHLCLSGRLHGLSLGSLKPRVKRNDRHSTKRCASNKGRQRRCADGLRIQVNANGP